MMMLINAFDRDLIFVENTGKLWGIIKGLIYKFTYDTKNTISKKIRNFKTEVWLISYKIIHYFRWLIYWFRSFMDQIQWN